MARLLLVRHGKTEGERDRYYGHIDIGLSQEGINQAEMLRDYLACQNLGSIYSSDLKRAFDTAEIIATAHKLKVMPQPELREFDFGKLAGMTFEEMKENYNGAVRLLSGHDLYISPPGGESLRQMSLRIQRFATQVQGQLPEQIVLVVAHAGSLKTLLCLLLRIGLEHWWQFHLSHASLTVVETYFDGTMLCLLNDTSHLERVRG